MSITHIAAAVRRLVIVRADNRCEYCLCPDAYSAFTFHIDHVVPEILGGVTEESNLAYSCGCNHFKATAVEAADPMTGNWVIRGALLLLRLFIGGAWQLPVLRPVISSAMYQMAIE
jgi:hypothetical protein